MLLKTPTSYGIFQKRRQFLKDQASENKTNGAIILLFAAFEESRHIFKQESSFYYFTGVNEPGAVLALFPDGREVLYIPNFGNERAKWVKMSLEVSLQDNGKSADVHGLTSIEYLGKQKKGYSMTPLFEPEDYEGIINDLRSYLTNNNDTNRLLTLLDIKSSLYGTSVDRFQHLAKHILSNDLRNQISIHDIAPLVHEMRRTKDMHELMMLNKAVEVTLDAQKRAAGVIKHGIKEFEVRAEIEHEFIYQGSFGPSFPSIVATGKNTTVLHYTELDQALQHGDLVVVDIGALYGYYCADITRTYPVSGTFSPRQREVYEAVLETQSYVATQAKPGMYLRNPEVGEQSLHYLAVQFLKNKGYDKYFVHGIGHYLGLDVHDVGDYKIPLREGDVFTIEPGIYIPEESLGVRIEDDYVITKDGCHCLSKALPKKIRDVEEMMREMREG